MTLAENRGLKRNHSENRQFSIRRMWSSGLRCSAVLLEESITYILRAADYNGHADRSESLTNPNSKYTILKVHEVSRARTDFSVLPT